jgi:peptidyl-prolyl cis-trans isomerase SurA
MTTLIHSTERYRQCTRHFVAVLMLMIVSAGYAQDKAARSARQPVLVDAIVAVVNTDVITMKELNDRVQIIEQRMRRQNMQVPPRDLLQKQLLERLIVNRAQMQMARDIGVRVDDTMLDRAVARIAEQNGITVQALRDQLERDGISFARFRDEIREEITLQRLREREVDNKLQITESEIDSFLASSTNCSMGFETCPPRIRGMAQNEHGRSQPSEIFK